MANVLTFNQVVDILTDIARRHYWINTFYLGKNTELAESNDIVYPLFAAYPDFARMPQTNGDYNTINIDLKCKVIDQTFTGEENKRHVQSDTLRIAQDIVNELNQHPYFQRSNVTLVGDINMTPLEEFEDDFTAGWEFTISLKLRNNNSYCGLPFEEIIGYSAAGPTSTGYSTSVQYDTANYYTTGATLNGTLLIFNRNDQLSAYTVDLSGIGGGTSGDLWSASTGADSIIANNNTGNIAAGIFGIAAGYSNRANGNYSVVINGGNNLASGNKSFIANGYQNSATTAYSTVVNGSYNIVSASNSFIGGGQSNRASGINSVIGGGNDNNVTGALSVVVGGNKNTAIKIGASILGGDTNTASGDYSVVAGGSNNTASGAHSNIVGGFTNTASGDYSTVVNGRNNFATSDNSAVIGGKNNAAKGNNVVVIGGQSITGSTADSIYTPNAYLAHTTGTKIYSGGTPLENIFSSTYVQPGLNTYTGGTSSAPSVNISAATLTYLSATTISGDTVWAYNDPWTIELMDGTTVDFYAPYVMSIKSYTNILGSPVISLKDDDVAYTTGATIAIGSKISVSGSTTGVTILNAVRL